MTRNCLNLMRKTAAWYNPASWGWVKSLGKDIKDTWKGIEWRGSGSSKADQERKLAEKPASLYNLIYAGKTRSVNTQNNSKTDSDSNKSDSGKLLSTLLMGVPLLSSLLGNNRDSSTPPANPNNTLMSAPVNLPVMTKPILPPNVQTKAPITKGSYESKNILPGVSVVQQKEREVQDLPFTKKASGYIPQLRPLSQKSFSDSEYARLEAEKQKQIQEVIAQMLSPYKKQKQAIEQANIKNQEVPANE